MAQIAGRRTRKNRNRRQRGGADFSAVDKARISAHFASSSQATKDQIIHCISQLRRFAICFQKGDLARMPQFAYNLGRLQELCGETTRPDIWWNPVEEMLKTNAWDALCTHTDKILAAVGTDYDAKTLAKGC
jgi:hypothetical protein